MLLHSNHIFLAAGRSSGVKSLFYPLLIYATALPSSISKKPFQAFHARFNGNDFPLGIPMSSGQLLPAPTLSTPKSSSV